MFHTIAHHVNTNSRLQYQGRFVTTRFLVTSGTREFLFVVHDGTITVTPGPFVMPAWEFALRAEPEAWERFWDPAPPPGWHDLFAMIKFRTLVAEGNLHPFMSNLLWFKEVLATPRLLLAGSTAEGIVQ